MINQEVGKQRFNHFKKEVLAVLTTALRAPLTLLMGCGQVYVDGRLRNIHDHKKVMMVGVGVFSTKPSCNEKKHGKIIGFVQEGQRIPDIPNSTEGKEPIHRHNGKANYGPYEYKYE